MILEQKKLKESAVVAEVAVVCLRNVLRSRERLRSPSLCCEGPQSRSASLWVTHPHPQKTRRCRTSLLLRRHQPGNSETRPPPEECLSDTRFGCGIFYTLKCKSKTPRKRKHNNSLKSQSKCKVIKPWRGRSCRETWATVSGKDELCAWRWGVLLAVKHCLKVGFAFHRAPTL